MKRVSTAADDSGGNKIWVVIEDILYSIRDYRYIIGPAFGTVGIPFDQIGAEAANAGEDFAINTIIPFRDNRVYLLLNRKSECNDNQFIQVNYDLAPFELINPITYQNLVGNSATFDVSFTPSLNQLYAHNTRKQPYGPNCDCQHVINFSKQDVRNARNIRENQNLIITGASSYYANGNLLFTVTVCTKECFTGRGCIAGVLDNIVVLDITRDNYEARIEGMRQAQYEIWELAPYYENGLLFFVGIFLRVLTI